MNKLLMTKIRSINSNKLYIAQNAEVSLKMAGKTAQATFILLVKTGSVR